MRICSRAGARYCTVVSAKPCATRSLALLQPNRNYWRVTSPRRKAAEERARLLIGQAEALGEPPEDPLILFEVLYDLFAANLFEFNRDMARDLAADCLALAEKQGATVPLMIGHRIMGNVLLFSGDARAGKQPA